MVGGGRGSQIGYSHPDVHARVEGVRWVENCVRSADAGGIWDDYS